MKMLVLEQNDRVSRIYQTILAEKKISVDFIKEDPSSFCNQTSTKYDLVVISSVFANTEILINKITRENPSQKIAYLEKYRTETDDLSNLDEKRREIVEKPFAFLHLIAQHQMKLKQNLVTH